MKPINEDESKHLRRIEWELNHSVEWPRQQQKRAQAMIWGGVLILVLMSILGADALSKQSKLGAWKDVPLLLYFLGGTLVAFGVEKQQKVRDDEIRTMGISLYRRLRLIEAEEEVKLTWKTHRGTWDGCFLRLMALSKNGQALDRPDFRIEIELNRMSEWYGGVVDKNEWED